MRKALLQLALAAFCSVAAGLAAAELQLITAAERLKLHYPAGETFALGRENWRIAPGRIEAALQPGFDDSKWYAGRAETTLSEQGFTEKRMYTIRKSFELPAGWENSPLLVDLGCISVCDETFLNGVRIGGIGGDPAKPVSGASWARRNYFVAPADKALKAGRNELVIFVFPGFLDGMYTGAPTLRKLVSNLSVHFNLKTPGPESLAVNLSDAAYLNRCRPGVPLALELAAACLAGEPQTAKLAVELRDAAGRVLQRGETSAPLRPGMKSLFSALRFTAPERYGTYPLRISVTGEDGKTLWEAASSLSVTEPVRFKIPVDGAIVNAPQRYEISRDSTGHFGPRRYREGKLVDKPQVPESRGGLAFSVRPGPTAPLLLMANVRPSPAKMPPANKFVLAAGAQYDGFPDAWLFGFVTPGGAGKMTGFTAVGDWCVKEWHYRFEQAEMKLRISAVHPAVRVSTAAESLRLFDRSGYYGTGVPTCAAGVVGGKVTVGAAAASFPAAELSENWLLVWFSGNRAYGEFDVPWLLVFQHKPTALKKSNALEVHFGERGVGEVLAMPLFGVTLQRPAETAKWRQGLPADVLARCRRWSRILAAAPQSPVRTFTADFAADRLTIHDAYTHRQLHDDWGTPAERIAPIYPVLPLALSNGTVKGFVHAPAADLDYATLHGPLFAIPGDGVTMRFDDLLHFTSEVREVADIARNEITDKLAARMRELMKSNVEAIREDRYIPDLFWHEMLVPGKLSARMADMLTALRRSDPALVAETTKAMRQRMEGLLLCTEPVPEWAKQYLRKDIRGSRPIVTVASPTGKLLSTFHPRELSCGIDCCCWESLRLYMLWDYARSCDRWELLKANLTLLRQLYNLIPNSHDWAVGISYDTFSGLRVGNGLQETGIMHAGMAAAARIAHHFGDTEWRDRAAYYATMQLVGLVGAMSANGYVRDHRPAVAGAVADSGTQFCMRSREIHYVEFNENGGFTETVISPEKLLNSLDSYVMTQLPEIMRPYRELFPKQTYDFFHPKSQAVRDSQSFAITPKVRQHMLKEYEKSELELYRKREYIRQEIWRELGNDLLPTLDSFGRIVYRKLWEK